MSNHTSPYNPLVSILIPAYNAEEFLGMAIKSALNQSWKNIEVVIVDDGSTDNTLHIAQKYASNAVKVHSQDNRGASAARNKCLELSKGAYIQYLDADDLLAVDKIESQLKADKPENCLISGAWSIFYDNILENQYQTTELWKNYKDPINWLVTAWTKNIWMHPASWLISRELVVKAGKWNEELSLHDDGEFFCRVILACDSIHFCESSLAFYRKGLSNSLSSLLSEKAVRSHLDICRLYETHLLNAQDTSRTRNACASNYQYFYFQYYPRFKNLTLQAIEHVKRLGGCDVSPQGTELFHLLRKVLGWRMARLVENFYYRNGLNRASWKKKLTNKRLWF